MELLSGSLEETKQTASNFLKSLEHLKNSATVVGLRGDLGSGKTTFVKFVAEHFGIGQTVSSPTFVIEKIYRLENSEFKNLIHIDAYRLEKGTELLSLGWKDITNDPNNLVFIEWPEKVKEILPKETKFVDFKFINENSRAIRYESGK